MADAITRENIRSLITASTQSKLIHLLEHPEEEHKLRKSRETREVPNKVQNKDVKVHVLAKRKSMLQRSLCTKDCKR